MDHSKPSSNVVRKLLKLLPKVTDRGHVKPDYSYYLLGQELWADHDIMNYSIVTYEIMDEEDMDNSKHRYKSVEEAMEQLLKLGGYGET
jgi:hypothetical protein